jgi:hypothetical protein
MIDEIYTIRLSNGDEIVTKIIGETESEYEVKTPLTVIPGPQGIQLVMSLFTADPDKMVILQKNHISMIAPSQDRVRDGYIETTTGIRPVSNKILMG